jgi:hypothetical protein
MSFVCEICFRGRGCGKRGLTEDLTQSLVKENFGSVSAAPEADTDVVNQLHFPETERLSQEDLEILEYGYSEDRLESALIRVNIHGAGEPALLDPGAQICIMHPEVYRRIPHNQRQKLKPMNQVIKSVTGSLVRPEGQAVFKVNFGNGISLRQRFVIVETDSPLILGLNFFRRPEVNWGSGDEVMTVKGTVFPVDIVSNDTKVWDVQVQGRTVLPPGCETLVAGRIVGKPHVMQGVVGPSSEEPSVMTTHYGPGSYNGHQEIRVAHCVVTIQDTVPVRVANFGTEPMVLKGGSIIGSFQCGQVHEEEDIPESNSSKNVPKHLQDIWEKCEPNLKGEQSDTVKAMLRTKQHCFSKSSNDYGRYSHVKHEINTGQTPPHRERP